MENPLELSPPNDPIDRVHAFARDLVYGVFVGKWGSKFYVNGYAFEEDWRAETEHIGGQKDPFIAFHLEKWNKKAPPVSLLVSLGYMKETLSANSSIAYVLTNKAFDLLNKPISPPSIFISYRRNESSALGLFIEARLKLIDQNLNVFIDKLLEPGDKWHAFLEEKVRQSQYFICLLGPASLGSKYVRQEIKWALSQANHFDRYTIIPVCHSTYSFGTYIPAQSDQDNIEIDNLINQLSIHNAIVVNPESAEEYELAIIKILNKLGYSNV